MSDPLNITLSVLAVVTAAIQSTNSLNETVKRFKERNKILGRLQGELENFARILHVLTGLTTAETSMLASLRDPIGRCSQICCKFEKSMEVFSSTTMTGFRDWKNMQFMGGDIYEFIDTIGGYKSTISVSLGTITQLTSNDSHVLREYNEMMQDTTYNLEVHLQRINQRMAEPTIDHAYTSGISGDLEDEIKATTQCLQICEHAKARFESLANREPSPTPRNNTKEVCAISGDVSGQNKYTIEDVIATGGSNQVVVNTSGGLFHIKKAISHTNSAQLVGSMTKESLDREVDQHYK